MNDQLSRELSDPLGLAAGRALADLATAAGLSLEAMPGISPPGEGAVHLGPLDWLEAEAAAGRVPLALVEANPAEVLRWLDQDVPLMAPLEAEAGGRPTDVPWIVLEAGEASRVLVRIHGGLEEGERELARAELTEFLAERLGSGEGAKVRWAQCDPVLVPPAAQEAASHGTPLHPLRRLVRLVKPDKRDLLAVAVFAIAIGVLLLATPIAVQALVNFVALGGAIPPLIVVVALLFLGLSFAGILGALQTWVVEILQRRVFVRAVADLSARLPRVRPGAHGDRYGPELVNRFFDLETIQKRGSFLLLDGLSVLLSVLVGLVVLAFYHPLLLAFDILLLAVIALIVLGPIRKGIVTAKGESSAKYKMAAWLEEIARSPQLFKTSGAMKAVFEHSDKLARNYIERRSAHFRIAFGQGIAAVVLQVLASTALLGIGGLLVIRGSLTLGQLVAAELILTLVVSSVAKMGKHLEAFYDLMAATDKVGMLLDLPLEREGGEARLPPEDDTVGARLEVCSVSWAPTGERPIFQDISLQVAPGERVGLRGPSGAGKSILLQMIWGLRVPTSGNLRVDDRDVRELSLESLRRNVALIDRVEWFEGTLRENVSVGRPFVSNDDVRSALRTVGILDDVERLPQGLDTELNVKGRPLSSGRLVRLQVARAIAGRPRLLLVSDFFEGLEESVRDAVMDVLFDEKAPWTLVFVTNAPSILQRCDRSFLLDSGRLSASSQSDLRPA